jgi:hypothetical protein
MTGGDLVEMLVLGGPDPPCLGRRERMHVDAERWIDGTIRSYTEQ